MGALLAAGPGFRWTAYTANGEECAACYIERGTLRGLVRHDASGWYVAGTGTRQPIPEAFIDELRGTQPDNMPLLEEQAELAQPANTNVAALVALEAVTTEYGITGPEAWKLAADVTSRIHSERATTLARRIVKDEQLAREAEPPNPDAYAELDTFLAINEPDHDWLIPGLIESGDRTIITARSGTGKSTLLRQIGVMAASGLHPFTVEPIDPLTVLYLDTENSARQVRREIRPLREAAGGYQDQFHLRIYGHSINLANQTTATELAHTVDRLAPHIILLGPLYKLAEGDPRDEQVAKAVADTLDQLRGIHGSALIIEAHSPYPTPGTKPTIRPYGASLWERWPEFGWYLNADGKTEHWRGQREERQWPTKLERSTPWPWTPAEPDEQPDQWDGPTHCIEAITHYLNTHPNEELSARQLETALRATGNGYRQSTVREAAERAAHKGHITMRIGPRNARLYTHTNNPKIDTSDPNF